LEIQTSGRSPSLHTRLDKEFGSFYNMTGQCGFKNCFIEEILQIASVVSLNNYQTIITIKLYIYYDEQWEFLRL